MLALAGSSALSEFRLQKLNERLAAELGQSIQVALRYWYLVDLSSALSEPDLGKLQVLLNSEAGIAQPAWIFAPRVGTVSPWSSKATDILHNCGLNQVKRVERVRGLQVIQGDLSRAALPQVAPVLHDRMMETVLETFAEAQALFAQAKPRPLRRVHLGDTPSAALQVANKDWGLALSDDEIDYLAESYAELGRDPTDAELMMFAQANSEHCRHKIFNADWIIDGERQTHSLFDMIRNTTHCSPDGVLSAYRDNSAVIQGHSGERFFPDPESRIYRASSEEIHILMKVETHNHPTAISPDPGAATGSGGEIRDEGATGVGSKPKAGLCGFSVSNLRIPGFEQPWEQDFGKPDRIAAALDIMLEGPIGAAAFNNEFGRPNLAGYFRSFEMRLPGERFAGYHKPIMIAGGLGNIRADQIEKPPFAPDTPLVVLGGPAMLIGLGGGAASSMASGASTEDLDFASVQRANPEMQRRCQEVIDRCWQLGEQSPIAFIHDVGAGGLSNALPELVKDGGLGGEFDLSRIPRADHSLSPMELWCNESQERYVLAIHADKLSRFEQICQRERCPFAVVGHAKKDLHLKLAESSEQTPSIDMPMALLFGKPPRMTRAVKTQPKQVQALDFTNLDLKEVALRVLRLPTVASKAFLITIGDRTVTGLVARDQMVGPWQVPVADVAVTLADYQGHAGEAMAMGERAPIALLDAKASARMAIGEAITNIAAAPIPQLADIKLSANWMAAAGHADEDAKLFEAVKTVGIELCPQLGIAVPVGKDSLSMKTVWQSEEGQRAMTAPLSLIISAFAPVNDVRSTLTPQLQVQGDTELLLIDLGRGKNRLGGSALAQVYGQLGEIPADVDAADDLKGFFAAIQQLNQAGYLLAYHDRSDGGLFATLVEMAFAGRCGLEIDLPEGDALAWLFSEELGAVIQVEPKHQPAIEAILAQTGLADCWRRIGRPKSDGTIQIRQNSLELFSSDRVELQQTWAETSYQMQVLRDNSQCALEEFERIAQDDPGLTFELTFDPNRPPQSPFVHTKKPKVAILREQGVNGQVEMAAAFSAAGFEAVDVHMSDILSGSIGLNGFQILAACGGFSYGDVLGAGQGWAKTILHNERARDQFQTFFQRDNSLTLGVCNGCQMLSGLKFLIPGAGHFPQFVRNRSEQFEARFSLVEVTPSPSVFLTDMVGSRMPIAIAHGEGRATFANQGVEIQANDFVGMRYSENSGEIAKRYPANPNGSPNGLAGLCNSDGRVTIMMPHPERVYRSVALSWHSLEGDAGPWLRLFQNAYLWLR